MDCKIGDVVHVRGKISDLDTSDPSASILFHVEFAGGGPGYWASKGDIVHVEPRPLALGDTVRHESCGWVVKGMEGDNLWLRRGYDGTYKAVFRSEVQPSTVGK